MPTGSTGLMASASRLVWRPAVTWPQLPPRPTMAARSKNLLELAVVPVSRFRPVSRLNRAYMPPPRSSRPRNPKRLVVLTPLDSAAPEVLLAALAAVRPLV